MSNNIYLEKSNGAEIACLFRVMNRYQVNCTLELNMGKESDPFIAVCAAPVSVEYEELETVTLKIGDMRMYVEREGYHFSQYVSGCQIYICIADDNFTAWFTSGVMPVKAIKEANFLTMPI